MAFDFPSSPTPGQTFFDPASGARYSFTNGAWLQVASSPVLKGTTSDAPPSNPDPGQLWWESDTGRMFIYYNDGNSSQWVQISGPMGVLGTAQAYNRIVNGAMQISQENGNTGGGTDGYHAADQWQQKYGTTATFNFVRVQSVTPNGSQDRIRLGVTAADTSIAATDYYAIVQTIEGVRVADFKWGTASARQVILRFGFRGPAGTYSVGLHNGAFNRSYIANFTISAGQVNTDTEQVIVIPGDTTGTWTTDNTLGLYLRIALAGGSNFQGVTGWQAGNVFVTSANTNGLATVSAIFELFDVGLYLDAQATGAAPPWEAPDFASELAACMRYWQKFTTVVFGAAANAVGAGCYYDQTYSVAMRIVPAVSVGTPTYGNSSTLTNGPSTNHCYYSITSTSTGGFNVVINPIYNARM